LILGLLVLLQSASFLVVSRWARHSTLGSISANLVLGVNNLDRQVGDRMAELADKARLVVGDYALRGMLLATDDPATVRSALLNFQMRVGSSPDRVRAARIVLLKPKGDVIAETGMPLADVEREIFRVLARRAQNDESPDPTASGSALLDAGLHGVLVVPVFAPAPELVAWMGFAFPIDGGFATQIKDMSRLELSFIQRKPAARLLASTLPDKQARALVASLPVAHLPERLAPRAENVVEVELGGERFVTLFRPLALVQGPPALAALQRSLDHELEPIRWLESLLLGTALAGLVVAALLAFQLARTVSRPVQWLAAHTRVIARGDYASRIAIAGAEEFEQLAAAFNAMSDGLAERDRVRDLLDKNVSPEVAARLLREGAALGGEEREVTILFADLREFTALSETLPACELVRELNRYLDRMSTAIEAEGGVIDKFIGDAIMALFGAPVGQDDAADRALRAALRMREALVGLNAELAAEGVPPLAFGIGINTAHVVAGNIGSQLA
jgi:adenylate cyclase